MLQYSDNARGHGTHADWQRGHVLWEIVRSKGKEEEKHGTCTMSSFQDKLLQLLQPS